METPSSSFDVVAVQVWRIVKVYHGDTVEQKFFAAKLAGRLPTYSLGVTAYQDKLFVFEREKGEQVEFTRAQLEALLSA